MSCIKLEAIGKDLSPSVSNRRRYNYEIPQKTTTRHQRAMLSLDWVTHIAVLRNSTRFLASISLLSQQHRLLLVILKSFGFVLLSATSSRFTVHTSAPVLFSRLHLDFLLPVSGNWETHTLCYLWFSLLLPHLDVGCWRLRLELVFFRFASHCRSNIASLVYMFSRLKQIIWVERPCFSHW